jgi:hypothetical protein
MQGSNLLEQAPAVRIVDGRVQVRPGDGPLAKVWLPKNGKVFAKIPPRKGNRQWLKEALEIRSPEFDGVRWELPRNSLGKMITAGVDRYGYVVVYRDISTLSRCTKACLEATGAECDCSCLGVHHGTGADGWYEQVGDAVAADTGEFTRSVIVYGGKATGTDGRMYDGQLHRQRYTSDRKARRDWPKASEFMCAGCLTERATVWDHCHTHGFVRAPLCNTCNTRSWSGWHPEYGRAIPSQNIDASYYRFCPRYGGEARRACSG